MAKTENKIAEEEFAELKCTEGALAVDTSVGENPAVGKPVAEAAAGRTCAAVEEMTDIDICGADGQSFLAYDIQEASGEVVSLHLVNREENHPHANLNLDSAT